jgi:hypothetical protein
MDKQIDIDHVLNMCEPSSEFFVHLEDNIYGIRFKGFKLRDYQTNEIFHNFISDDIYELDYFAENELSYIFPSIILKSQNLGSNITLVVGDHLVKDLTLIERHYIDNKLQANYKFDFPVFLPNSENNVEFMYNVPQLSKETQDNLDKGGEINAKSDTFIFVEGKLMIHRRTNYIYTSCV